MIDCILDGSDQSPVRLIDSSSFDLTCRMGILITGSDGFVGSHLVGRCPESLGNLFAPSFSELDLTNSIAVKTYLSGKHIDYCIHSATTLRSNAAYPVDVCDSNLRMFYNLIRYLPSSCRIINLGSGSEYSREFWHLSMSEAFFGEHIPADAHSFSKYVISSHVESMSLNRIATIRIFGIFGEREDYLYKFISNTIAKAVLGVPIVLNQDRLFNYIDVVDFCSIIYNLISGTELYRYKSLNVGHPMNLKLSAIVSSVWSIVNPGSPLELIINNKELGLPYTPCLERMTSLLGRDFRFTPMEESLHRLVGYFWDIRHKLDIKALEDDDYMRYAKSLVKNQ